MSILKILNTAVNEGMHTIMMQDKPIAITHCPICKKTTLWTDENPYRPFCSKRCQLIDFGEWAKESYKINGEEGEEKNTSQ